VDRNRLLAKAQEIRSQMRKLEFLLQATVLQRRTKCGTPSCRCARGELHTSWSVTYKEKNKTRTICIDPAMLTEVQQWAKNWKRFRQLLKQHNALLLASIRTRSNN
jgi:hypothetical protein